MASYNSRIRGSSSTQSSVVRFIGEGLPFQISSQNPNEEIMNVLARQIPIAEDGGDRRADLLSRVPRSSSAWAGVFYGDRTVGQLALREVERITSLLPLQCNSIKVKTPAQAELERGTLESCN